MSTITAPRPRWQSLTRDQKRERLHELRRHQQRTIEVELRLLHHVR